MVKSLIFGGVLTTVIMFSGVTFADSSINADSIVGQCKINMEKTVDNVCIGQVFRADLEDKNNLEYQIKEF